jgi:hypothetical protein
VTEVLKLISDVLVLINHQYGRLVKNSRLLTQLQVTCTERVRMDNGDQSNLTTSGIITTVHTSSVEIWASTPVLDLIPETETTEIKFLSQKRWANQLSGSVPSSL